MSAFFRARDLSALSSDGRRLAQPVSFSLAAGECVLISGANGAGKTSLLRAILRLQKAAGSVQLDLRRDQVSYLPQAGNARFFLPLSLRDVVFFSEGPANRIDVAGGFGLLSESDLEKTWNRASGGERQKAQIARALLSSPRLLILDEPFNHLDEKSRRRCCEVLQAYLDDGWPAGDGPGSLLLVSHETQLEGLTVRREIHLAKADG